MSTNCHVLPTATPFFFRNGQHNRSTGLQIAFIFGDYDQNRRRSQEIEHATRLWTKSYPVSRGFSEQDKASLFRQAF